MLGQHPAVREVVVLAREDEPARNGWCIPVDRAGDRCRCDAVARLAEPEVA